MKMTEESIVMNNCKIKKYCYIQNVFHLISEKNGWLFPSFTEVDNIHISLLRHTFTIKIIGTYTEHIFIQGSPINKLCR